MDMFIADTHFGHENIINVCRPQFNSIDKMNHLINDYFLKGDFFMKIILRLVAAAIVVYILLLTMHLPTYLLVDNSVSLDTSSGDTMTIMSTNVRYIAPEDIFNKSWFKRAGLIAEEIEDVQPDIIGFQEATFVHYNYLKKIMTGYDSEMAYRDEFILSEGCPIFYRTDRYEKIDSGSFWLSETPEVMSKDWGSEHYRICVYVILRDVVTDKQFAVFNTHLDHTSDEARINGIAVVLDKIAEFGDLPAYLMGDMNAKENSKTIESTKDSFDDANKISVITEDTATFHGWGKAADPRRIDYILISKGDAEVYEYHVVNNLHDGIYSSDHASIYIKTKLK